MDISPAPKKRWFNPSFNVRFDSPQEVKDFATHGELLPFPTIAGLRTLAVSTSTKVAYPTVVEYGPEQLREIAENLSVAAIQPEVVGDPEQVARLMVEATIISAALDNHQG